MFEQLYMVMIHHHIKKLIHKSDKKTSNNTSSSGMRRVWIWGEWFPYHLFPCPFVGHESLPQQRTCHLYPSSPHSQAPWLWLKRVTWPLHGEQQVDGQTERGRFEGNRQRKWIGENCLFASLQRGDKEGKRGVKRRGGGLWVDAASGWYAAVYWGDEAPPAQEEVGEFVWGQHR